MVINASNFFVALVIGTSAVIACTGTAAAHGFGARYDLPVPLSYYVFGASASVILSFVIIGKFIRDRGNNGVYPRVNILNNIFGRAVINSAIILPLQTIAVVVLISLIFSGFMGTQAPSKNLAPTMIWVVFWVGLAYISAIIGNVWPVINPWKSLFECMDSFYRRIDRTGSLTINLRLPKSFELWPAVGLFLIFAWLECAYTGASSPRGLAILVTSYSIITLTGMFLFGKNIWLRNGEVFTLIFGIFAKFSISEVRVNNTKFCLGCVCEGYAVEDSCVDCYECFKNSQKSDREFNLRPFASGLIRKQGVTTPTAFFILILLATVSFDGFTATSAWKNVYQFLFPYFNFWGQQAATATNTFGLALSVLLFATIYGAFTKLIVLSSGQPSDTFDTARGFALTLVPIALAYHLAHYFSFLLIQGQLIVPLISDPLGRHWNLFGSADYIVNIGVVNARFTWLFSVGAIAIGHIIAVYLAHVAASRIFRGHGDALSSQYPMLILMVGYTMTSLWILAQPIVK